VLRTRRMSDFFGPREPVGGGRRPCATVFPVADRAPLAQLAEQRTLNPRVRGSSPWRRTIGRLRPCHRSGPHRRRRLTEPSSRCLDHEVKSAGPARGAGLFGRFWYSITGTHSRPAGFTSPSCRKPTMGTFTSAPFKPPRSPGRRGAGPMLSGPSWGRQRSPNVDGQRPTTLTDKRRSTTRSRPWPAAADESVCTPGSYLKSRSAGSLRHPADSPCSKLSTNARTRAASRDTAPGTPGRPAPGTPAPRSPRSRRVLPQPTNSHLVTQPTAQKPPARAAGV
jgi:hypothetical protein